MKLKPSVNTVKETLDADSWHLLYVPNIINETAYLKHPALLCFNVFSVGTGNWSGIQCRKELFKERLQGRFLGKVTWSEMSRGSWAAFTDSTNCQQCVTVTFELSKCAETRAGENTFDVTREHFVFVRCRVTHRCRFGSAIVFASITELKGLTEWFHSLHAS